MSTLKVNAIRHPDSTRDNITLNSNGTVDKPILLTRQTNELGGVGSLSTSAANGVANVGIIQPIEAQIEKGTTGFTTSGTNAYTFVCPVAGVYAVNAHVSYGNITPGRVIWVMCYTSGGGNIPLTNYVEVMDHTSIDYANITYFNLWEFGAGDRIGMGKNSASGTQTNQNFQWGIHLVACIVGTVVLN